MRQGIYKHIPGHSPLLCSWRGQKCAKFLYAKDKTSSKRLSLNICHSLLPFHSIKEYRRKGMYKAIKFNLYKEIDREKFLLESFYADTMSINNPYIKVIFTYITYISTERLIFKQLVMQRTNLKHVGKSFYLHKLPSYNTF